MRWIVVTLLFCISVLEGSVSEKLQEKIGSEQRATPTIGRILITNMKNGINQPTWIYVNQALNYFKKTKPLCVILELNTPGGEVFAAEQIADSLKNFDTQYNIPVIAYVNNWAISAGALLAYSCRYIVIAKDASMGAAEPVLLGEGGKMETASEKINSALRASFINRAEFFGRNGSIAEAMVDKDVILVLRDGKVMKLNREEDIVRAGPSPDIIVNAKGKLLTLHATQLMEYGVADELLEPVSLPALSSEEESTGAFSLSKSPFSQITYFKQYPECTIDTFQMDWQTKFLSFLASPMVTSALFLGLIVGGYIELSAPGFGLPGVVSLVSLFLLFLSSFAMETISMLEPLLLIFGLFLILLELFFFPTLGILIFLGALFILAGLAGMTIPGLSAISFHTDQLSATGSAAFERLSWIGFALTTSLVLIVLISRYVTPKAMMMKNLVLGDTELLKTGTHAMHAHSVVEKKFLSVGMKAVANSMLRPAGKILVDDEEYDAISIGTYIEKGRPVTIVEIEGEKITVQEVL